MVTIHDDMRSQFTTWAKDFKAQYLLAPAGERHMEGYKVERECVARYWEEAKAAKNAGQDITDVVLYKLLPYANTTNNRAMGHRISIAPAITKDIKTWFESQKPPWQKHENWPNVANAIYDLVFSLVEHRDWSSLKKFADNKVCSRGLQAGMITPTLHCLRPEFRIINSKTTRTVNKLLGPDAIKTDLAKYESYLTVVDEAVAALGIPLLRDKDVFDAFCHWMCAVAKHAPRDGEDTKPGPAPLPPPSEGGPRDHWEAIHYIVRCGNLLDYQTYVADPSKVAFDKKLGELATLRSVPPTLAGASEIGRVDVIWYKPSQPCYLFEVEDGGTMRDALLRLYNAMHFNAHFFIVCPPANKGKFEKWVSQAPFQECAGRYGFRTYNELFDFYRAVEAYATSRAGFLDGDTEESA